MAVIISLATGCLLILQALVAAVVTLTSKVCFKELLPTVVGIVALETETLPQAANKFIDIADNVKFIGSVWYITFWTNLEFDPIVEFISKLPSSNLTSSTGACSVSPTAHKYTSYWSASLTAGKDIFPR